MRGTLENLSHINAQTSLEMYSIEQTRNRSLVRRLQVGPRQLDFAAYIFHLSGGRVWHQSDRLCQEIWLRGDLGAVLGLGSEADAYAPRVD
jgi:hypothetical protein